MKSLRQLINTTMSSVERGIPLASTTNEQNPGKIAKQVKTAGNTLVAAVLALLAANALAQEYCKVNTRAAICNIVIK